MDKEKLKLLLEPFDPQDIEWRVQQSGIKNDKAWAMVLAYVQNRAVQQRLDDVCGPENWRNKYDKAPDNGVMCGISIRIDGEWVEKWDGAENTQVEAVKGGLSASMKRAAVQWGIGRYLYNLESTFVQVTDKGEHYIGVKENKDDKYPKIKGYWNDPVMPNWALPPENLESKKKEIRELAKAIGTPEESIVTRLAEITTIAQANESLKRLKG